ncbi:MAG: DUF2059 domain-containing protein [Spirochaetaceae bacterium]|jgi:hypothetical protein|nr:DUF2059 domain-containing protein [Spirochaetaceae bacterium]
MKKYIWIILVFGSVFSASSQTKEEEIMRLLDLMGTKNLAKQTIEMFIPRMQVLAPSVPKEFWDLFIEKMDLDLFIKAYVPLYDRHYTLEDIRALITFYESPVGKKVVEVTPLITAESLSLGEEWGLLMGELILEELKKAGYEGI